MSSQKKHLSKKIKILFHSCHSRQLSGFGKNCKNVLRYLCSTEKYEIIEVANSYSLNDENLKDLPWKCLGSGPDEKEEIIKNNENELLAREMSYGLLKIDEIIAKEKPDIYIGSEDIWAFIKTVKKPWWNKIPCMIWTTLDSLPLLPEALTMAPQIQHFYTWAPFAKRAMHKAGFKHVGSLNGSIETKQFFKLSREQKEQLRIENKIPLNSFIIGFVFRNQTRKSVPNLIQAFSKFMQNKTSPVFLLLHTGWHEGWDILSLAKEHNVPANLILTTYYCKNCKKYKIKSFEGQSTKCDSCQSESLNTISVQNGPSEKQLNEIYNFMDVYCHPFTSGGQEIPIQEAKLTELITLVTNYSCGEDMCVKNSGTIPLSWTEYREPGTQFIKASTNPDSILENLNKVYKMSDQEKNSLGKIGRNFVIENFDSKVVGKKLDDILSKIKLKNYDFDFSTKHIDPDYRPPRITEDSLWITDIYKNMFSKTLSPKDEIVRRWREKLNSGATREHLLSTFINLAKKELSIEHSFEERKSLIVNSGIEKNKRIGVCCEGDKSETFFTLTALHGIQKIHQDKKIFFITHPANFTIINSNNFIFKKIPYFKEVENKNFQKEFFSNFYNFSNLDYKEVNLEIDPDILK